MIIQESHEKLLKDIRDSNTLLLVEGKKDRKVLEKMDLENIVEISGKRLEEVVDILEKKGDHIVILTDYDKEGIIQYKRLKDLLLPTGMKINDKMRRRFKTTFLINKIEELSNYFK